jgi:hypothetical protein
MDGKAERERGKGGVGTCFEANAEQGVELEREVVAEVAEGADLRLIRCDGGWDGLLGFAVDELAKVECSDNECLCQSGP